MARSVIDLTAEELGELAREAWSSAARGALAKGLSVTGSHGGRRYRYYPDGRIEDLGPVAVVGSLEMPKSETRIPAAARESAERRVSHPEGIDEKTKGAGSAGPGTTDTNADEIQKFGKDSMDTVMASFDAWTKTVQAIAAEIADFSKKYSEESTAASEKLMTAKSLETAMEVQTEYVKSSYEGFVAEATRLSELYADLAREAYIPMQANELGALTQKLAATFRSSRDPQ
jgi:phasin family protein